jgi:hypothetical protein
LHILLADDLYIVACNPTHSQRQLDGLYIVACNPTHSQRQLDGLAKLCAPNQLLGNNVKTKCQVWGNLDNVSLIFNGKAIEQTLVYKCLGNLISRVKNISGDLFKQNYAYLCNRARQTTFGFVINQKPVYVTK